MLTIEYSEDFLLLTSVYDGVRIRLVYPPFLSTYYLSRKLIKRTVFPDHLALLTKRQDDLLAQLGELAKAIFARKE